MEQIGGKNYCFACASKKEKNEHDRKELYAFIQETFNITYPTGLMLRQIKTFHEERKYSYKNIRLTIDYIIRIQKKTMYSSAGLALVPYIYDEMIDYYKDLIRRRSETTLQKSETKVVTMKRPAINNTQNDLRNKKIVNMENMEARLNEQ